MLEMNKQVIAFVKVSVKINNMNTKKTDELDDKTQAYLEFYFQPLEQADEELDDVNLLEDLVEDD